MQWRSCCNRQGDKQAEKDKLNYQYLSRQAFKALSTLATATILAEFGDYSRLFQRL